MYVKYFLAVIVCIKLCICSKHFLLKGDDTNINLTTLDGNLKLQLNQFGNASYRNYQDICSPAHCNFSGHCLKLKSGFVCSCYPGFQGPKCSEPDYCYGNQCVHGSCVSERGSANYSCQCRGVAHGRYCDQLSPPQSCSKVCKLPKICNESTDQCVCFGEAYGDSCMSAVEICNKSHCPSNSTCIPRKTTPYYECKCLNGFFGTDCRQHECDSCKGTCVQTGNSFRCKCSNNQYGLNCSKTFDSCRSLCKNGGNCDQGRNKCSCKNGFFGPLCQYSESSCEYRSCLNGGICSKNYECLCPLNFTGDFCELDVKECDILPSVCGNGSCREKRDGYECVCDKGFYGNHCQYNLCDNVYCVPGRGHCIINNTKAVCKCIQGYGGSVCNLSDKCKNVNCENNGTCHMNYTKNEPWCKCPYHIGGERCEVKLRPCQYYNANFCNHGTCVDNGTTPYCKCDDWHVGPRCDNEKDLCKDRPCANAATCLGKGLTFRCFCAKGYTGVTCNETEPADKGNKDDWEGKGEKNDFSMIVITSGIIVLLLILALVVMVYKATASKATASEVWFPFNFPEIFRKKRPKRKAPQGDENIPIRIVNEEHASSNPPYPYDHDDDCQPRCKRSRPSTEDSSADGDGFTPLMKEVCLRGNETPNNISNLIRNCNDINAKTHTRKQTALHLAIERRFFATAKVLVEAGANCNIVDHNGRTPFMAAIAAEGAETAFYILSKCPNLNINHAENDGTTALMMAAERDFWQLMKDTMIPRGADVSLVDNRQRTALHRAALVDAVRACHILVSNNANIDAVDEKERTPLFLACYEGNIDVIKYLLQHNCSKEVSDRCSIKPEEVARERGYIEAANLVQNFSSNGMELPVVTMHPKNRRRLPKRPAHRKKTPPDGTLSCPIVQQLGAEGDFGAHLKPIGDHNHVYDAPQFVTDEVDESDPSANQLTSPPCYHSSNPASVFTSPPSVESVLASPPHQQWIPNPQCCGQTYVNSMQNPTSIPIWPNHYRQSPMTYTPPYYHEQPFVPHVYI